MPDAASPEGMQDRLDPRRTLVAIKQFRPEISKQDIAREIEALARSSSRHSLELLDLSSDRDGRPLLVLQRLSSQSLADLLRLRRPSAGEAVTILAPLVSAVEEMHAAGVVHQRIEPASIRFDESGAPILAAFGSAMVLEPTPGSGTVKFSVARLSSEAGVIRDLVSVLELSRLVLGVWGSCLNRLSDPATKDDPFAWLEELRSELFSLAEPEPVAFGLEEQGSGQFALPNRIGAQTAPPSAAGEEGGDPQQLEAEPETAVSGQIQQLLAKARRWLARLKIRPKSLVVAGGGLVLVLLTLLIPSRSPNAEADSQVSPGPSPSVAQVEVGKQAQLAINGDDPLAAARALLEVRSECLKSGSLSCLELVDQSNSVLLDADRHRIERDGKIRTRELELAFDLQDLVVVQQLGDSAMIGIGDSGSAILLLIRDEDGWKLRDLLDPASAD